jgi:glutamine amidotransferase
MCRWIAYRGETVALERYVTEPAHSLVVQSLRAKESVGATNGDGFGLGWYGDRETPGLYRSVAPAWGDRNLRDLAGQITSRLFLGHVRAATGTPVEQSNCHPFRHGRWLFVHNGFIDDYAHVRRDLLLAVDPDLFPGIEGTTDSEVLFHLALTFGLEEDPLAGLERAAGFVEETGRRHGVAEPLQMTVGLTDGVRVYAARYASGPVVNSLFVSEDATAVRALYPDDERFRGLGPEARVVVSEPLGDLPGVWREVPAGSAVIVQPGEDREVAFAPRRAAQMSSS